MIKTRNKIIITVLIFTVIVLLGKIRIYAISGISNTYYEGIDVSNWQGYIDYEQVKNNNIEVVYIKASEGRTFIDPYLDYNYNNAKQNGLKVGFYHYVDATTVEAAKQEAEFFANVISGKEYDCKLAMDYEEFSGVGIEQSNEIAKTFLETIQSLTGTEAIVYSNLTNARNRFSSEIADNYKLWFAYYGDYNGLANIKTSWDYWIGVQYTNQGRIGGINGNVDRDRFTEEIFLDGSTQPTPEPPDNNTEIIYTVKPGDTLWAISRMYGVTINQIVALNNIPNPNLIYPGQQFIIKSSISNVVPQYNYVYKVKRGDCLWNISRRYGVSVNYLVRLNNIQNPNLIYIGQIIYI